MRVDPLGKDLWSFNEYDAIGNLTRNCVKAEGCSDFTLYDKMRRLKTASRSAYTGGSLVNEGLTEVTYDADGRVLEQKSCAEDNEFGCSKWLTSTTWYLANGQVDYMQDALGKQTKYTYDNEDRVQTVTDAEKQRVRNIYNAAGQLLELWQEKLDANDVVIFSERQRTNIYDSHGALIQIKDARDNVTTYVRDDYNRPTRTTFPDASYEEAGSYDNNGNAGSIRLRNAETVSFTYDALNRVTLKNLPGSEPDVTTKYSRAGQVRYLSQSGINITYHYDTAGRSSSIVRSDGKTVAYTHDLLGGFNSSFKRIKITYPGTDGFEITYKYDTVGKLDKIYDDNDTIIADYTSDLAGRRTNLEINGNKSSVSYTYNDVSALTDLDHSFTGGTGNVSYEYTYNDVHQIDGMDLSNTSYLWTPNLNVTVDHAANSVNQYTRVWGQTLEYNANGNLDKVGQNSFTYDSQNRLIRADMKSRGTDTTYSYGPENRRYKKDVDGSVTSYAYNGGEVIAEYSGFGSGATLLRRYIYGPGTDELLARIEYNSSGTETSRVFYHADHQGSIIAEVNSSGNQIETFAYSPFGESVGGDPENLESGNVYRYTGRRFDMETGLYYYRARYYAPGLGRFMSPDPIGYGDGLNMYAYVGNDPLNFTDPSGLLAQQALEGTASTIMSLTGAASAGQAQYHFENGNYGQAVLHEAMAFLEAGLTVASAGQSSLVASGLRSTTNYLSGLSSKALVSLGLKSSPSFGTLSKAGEYGIQTYGKLRSVTQGTGLQAHHLIEKRFVGTFEMNATDMLSIAVSPSEHQVFTNAWRKAIPYGVGTVGATKDQIFNAAREIYKEYPAILNGLGL